MNYALPKEFSDVIVQDNLFQIQELLTKCVNEFLEKSIYYCITASAMLKLCLIESLKKTVKFGPNQELAGRIQKYIHNHYHLQELTNEDVAKEFNYHPFYLSRVMKEATGKTLHQYLVYYRIHMAKNYLITTDLNICMIADITGFSSCSHFIKIFREQTGVTPRQYKKTHINFGF